MDDNNNLKLFGFEIKRADKKKEEERNRPAIVPPTDPDGAGYVTSSGLHYGHYLDLDDKKSIRDSIHLIKKYRAMAENPDVDMAIKEIVSEAIVTNESEKTVSISFDDKKKNSILSEKIKDKITEEFDVIYNMLDFSNLGYDMFRNWYIDGRLVHQLVVDREKLNEGIIEIRNIDAAKIRKVKKVEKKKDPKTRVAIISKVDEFFIFENEESKAVSVGTSTVGKVKLSKDAISYVTSGQLDSSKKRVVSHLHKAIRPSNQLGMMEDSLVIYRLSRAPERRIFYIDVGNLSTAKAEQYMQNIQTKYRNKLVYDADTGQIRDNRKHMSMLEDIWLPRKAGGRGTEISTLPGGQNLGQIEDILYFQKKLYKALNVPLNRLSEESPFSMGRSSEITRDEVKFQKFIDRLRTRFSNLFLDILRKQLILKNIINEDDWDKIEDSIYIDYQRDNHFSELKESELMRERNAVLSEMEPFLGRYYTDDYIYRKVLRYDEDQIKATENFKEEKKKELEAEERGMNQSHGGMNDDTGNRPEPRPTPKPDSGPD